MPAGSPFTLLCQQLAVHQDRGRADLHLHSIYSDGLFTPPEIVQRAMHAGLFAIALTDHDTLSGHEPTLQAARAAGSTLEVIPGVEITCEYAGRELHLLAYFVRPTDAALCVALEYLRQKRFERYHALAERLRGRGLSIEDAAIQSGTVNGGTLGRRHLAQLLVETRQVRTTFEAFSRYLCDPELTALPKGRLAVAEAITLVKNAGGISSWAHPPSDVTMEQIRDLQAVGLDAVEAVYPWAKPSHGRRLRAIAEELGLGVTGGSDCHGPQPNHRAIGSRTINRLELDLLRRRLE